MRGLVNSFWRRRGLVLTFPVYLEFLGSDSMISSL